MPDGLSLMERYLRYKRGTEKITSWLAATASKHCDISQLVSALKTKSARKTAAQGGTVELLAGELVGLALAITKKTPPISVPDKILTALTKTIEGRQAVADIYKTKSADDERENTQKNQGHQHFISILIEVELHLRQAAESAAQTAHSQMVPSQDGAHTANTENKDHENLDVEEEDIEEEDIEENSSSNHSSPSKAANFSKATFILKKQDHEDVLACLCFLESLRDVRRYVVSTWEQYMRGEVTFIVASMTAHTAVSLLKCAEEEFVASNPAFDTWDRIGGVFQVKVYHDNIQALTLIVNLNSEGPLSAFADIDLADLLAETGRDVAGMLYDRLCWVGNNDRSHRKRGPRIGQRKNHSAVRRKLGQHPTVKMLLENAWTAHVDDFPLYGRGKELMGALKCYRESGRLPTWLVVALQMYVDVGDILGPNVHDGKVVFRQALREAEAQYVVLGVHLQQFPGYVSDLAAASKLIGGTASAAREVRLALDKDFSVVQRGDVFSPRFEEQRSAFWKLMANDMWQSLEHLLGPEIGCAAFDAKFRTAMNAVKLGRFEHYIPIMALIYLAGQNLQLLPVWPDMDFLIASQPDLPDLAQVADDPGILFKAFQRLTGAPSVRLLLKHVDRTSRVRPERKMHPLHLSSKIALGFMEFLTVKEPLPLNKRLQRHLHAMRGQSLKQARIHVDHSHRDDTEQKDFQPVELLSTFKDQLKADEPSIYFDYLRLWSDCATLTHAIAQILVDDGTLGEWDGPRFMAAMVGYPLIYSHAVMAQSPELLADSDLAKAAKIMEAHINSKGDRYKRAAESRSSGHIPDESKPSQHNDEVLTAEQKQHTEGFRRAGTSVSTSGGVLVLHHPMLTMKELQTPAGTEEDRRGIACPEFMYSE